ncbi:MAG: TetR/AcrR family transcriptional regulator [Lysobacteraceae bacterium]|nr:MAG: TetR/AcrR family transcriptional regulator [Xanthomonadaceae bacterium]
MPDKKTATPRINLVRRAEIATEKRNRTRATLLIAAFHLIGEESGQFQRVEDFCQAAAVSRGSFYKYFTGIANLYAVLAEELSSDFDAAVHQVMDVKTTAAARASAAVRYNLQAAIDNPRWGWAMIHTGMGSEVFGPGVSSRARTTIAEGMASGEFRIATPDLGKAILLGAALGATLDILHGRNGAHYPEQTARSILLALGVEHTTADAVVSEELPVLRPIEGVGGASPVNFWSEIGAPCT